MGGVVFDIIILSTDPMVRATIGFVCSIHKGDSMPRILHRLAKIANVGYALAAGVLQSVSVHACFPFTTIGSLTDEIGCVSSGWHPFRY